MFLYICLFSNSLLYREQHAKRFVFLDINLDLFHSPYSVEIFHFAIMILIPIEWATAKRSIGSEYRKTARRDNKKKKKNREKKDGEYENIRNNTGEKRGGTGDIVI